MEETVYNSVTHFFYLEQYTVKDTYHLYRTSFKDNVGLFDTNITMQVLEHFFFVVDLVLYKFFFFNETYLMNDFIGYINDFKDFHI